MDRVARLLYFLAPAYLADMAPPFVRYWPWWNRPISTRWLGSHKTLVGFAFGVIVAVLTTWIQAQIDWSGGLVRYDDWLSLGLRFGVGAMGGDSVKSFVKRRIGIPPGRPWIPADQLDYVIGVLLLLGNEVCLSAVDLAIITLGSFVGHFAVTRVGYWLGVRDVPY